jgi:hypothetical protein
MILHNVCEAPGADFAGIAKARKIRHMKRKCTVVISYDKALSRYDDLTIAPKEAPLNE